MYYLLPDHNVHVTPQIGNTLPADQILRVHIQNNRDLLQI